MNKYTLEILNNEYEDLKKRVERERDDLKRYTKAVLSSEGYIKELQTRLTEISQDLNSGDK